MKELQYKYHGENSIGSANTGSRVSVNWNVGRFN